MDFSTYTQKNLPLNGVTLQYWTNNNSTKPVIFLLHGAAMDHAMFAPQLEVLKDYNVICWDARGHGASRPVQGQFGLGELAADCLAVLDALRIETAILVGQSEGGMIAQEVYRLQPNRVRAIATVGASPIMIPYSSLDMWLLKMSTSLIKLWPYANFMSALAKKTAIKPTTQAYALETVGKISKPDFLSIWDGVTKTLRHEGIPGMHIVVPLLICYGDHDTTGTVKKNNERWKIYEPTAELKVIPEAGHNANQDNAPAFNAMLRQFLERLEKG